MTLSVIKTKRKISCLLCRLKKVKCDGGQPCERCIKKDCSNQCTYSKQRPLGRPPKNAVVNKLILSRTKQPYSTNSVCRDFIIENLAYTIPSSTKYLYNDKTKTLDFFMESYFCDTFSTAVTQLAIRRVGQAPDITASDIKIYDLLDSHSWTTAELTNIYISKISSLPLDNAREYNSIASAMFQELTMKYFGEPPIGAQDATINLLTTLPTPQATRLIECFFCIHPHSYLLNKTLLLQAFWTDSIDPLLLCVIYGTTSYFAKMLEGKPVCLWEATSEDRRSPFLDYAYLLLHKSSSEATLVKYQAVILLSLFESRYGLPKRGMVLGGLAYMIAGKLGVLDGSLLSTEISDVESELLSYAYWTHFTNTIRGSVDVGHAARFTKDFINPPPLPPVSLDKSLSHQLDSSSGNQRLFRSYYLLVETFYVSCVVSKYINKCLLLFPDVKFNVTCNGKPQNTLQVAGSPKVEGLVAGLSSVVSEFGIFIQENHSTWSQQQRYTINIVWMLLDIHLIFIKDHRPAQEGTDYTNSIFDIFTPTQLSSRDPKTMARVHLATPKIFTMIDTTQAFLSEPSNFSNRSTVIPRSLIVSVLETAITVLCLKHQTDQDSTAWDYLNQISSLTKNTMWADWTTIKSVREKIDSYLDQSIRASSASGSLPSPSPGTFTVDDDLGWAAFFDPCSDWLAPFAQNLPLDTPILWDSFFPSTTATQPDLSFLLPLIDNGTEPSSHGYPSSYPHDMTSLALTPLVGQHPHSLSTNVPATPKHPLAQEALLNVDLFM